MNYKHKPTAMKLLAGCPGHKPLPANEPQPKLVLPKPPKRLDANGKKEWTRLATMLYQLGVMTELDTIAFEVLITTWLRWCNANELIKTNGLLIVGQNGILQRNPAIKIADDSLKNLEKLLSDFGATPSSRARVKANPQPEIDELERFFTTI